MIRVLIAALFMLGIVSLALPADAQTRLYPCPQVGAHRGERWPSPYTQDSRLAIGAALADPAADFVESDVWPTKDGKGLMQHSNHLSEATNATGLVSHRTFADIRAHVRMHDGSVPESLTEYLRQVVTSKKHAILHYKGHGYSQVVAAAMRRTGARAYVRIMVASPAQVVSFKHTLPGYFFELAAATGAYAAQAKALGVRVMIVPASVVTAPSSWIKPYIHAGVPVDYVTYRHAQDVQARQWPFRRVLTAHIASTRTVLGCPA
jgi:hypothetical protein